MTVDKDKLLEDVKKYVAYRSFVGIFLNTVLLEEGEFFRIQKDLDVSAFTCMQDGFSVCEVIVNAPFILAEVVQVRSGSIDLNDPDFVVKAGTSIIAEETKKFSALIQRAGESNRATGPLKTIFGTARVSLGSLKADKFILNPKTFEKIRGPLSDLIDLCDENTIGYVGMTLGTNIFINDCVPEQEVWALAEPSVVGGLGIVGFVIETETGEGNEVTVVEILQMGIGRPRGVAIATITDDQLTDS